MATVTRSSLTFNRLLKCVALVCFAAAFCVAENWLTVGLWTEWTAAGLAAFTAAEVI